MSTIKVFDSTEGSLVNKWEVDYIYLHSRAQKALNSVLPGKFTVAPVIPAPLTIADIGSQATDSSLMLVAIVKAGQLDMVSNLYRAEAGAKRQSQDKSDLASVVNGSGRKHGISWGRLAFVGTPDASIFPGSKGANQTVISNLLIHEIGHMVLTFLTGKADEDRDHRTQAVMRAELSKSDGELNYSALLQAVALGKPAATDKPKATHKLKH